VFLFQELPHGTTSLPIAITDEHATTSQDAIEPSLRWRMAWTTNASSG
jgi:hypothetical protein